MFAWLGAVISNSSRSNSFETTVQAQRANALAGRRVALPLAARAQQGGMMRRIGALMHLAESDPEAQARVRACRSAALA